MSHTLELTDQLSISETTQRSAKVQLSEVQSLSESLDSAYKIINELDTAFMRADI